MKHFRKWLLPLFVLILQAIILTGCGNTNDEFVVTPPAPTLVNQPFAGKLFLGAGVPGVPITVETLDGQVLASQTTDGSGNYYFDRALPVDFRVVARLNELEFSREVRGFGSRNIFGTITVPTTAVSLLAQAQPGAPIETVEAQIREKIGLSPGESLAKIDESVNETFSHLAFFARAERNGGVMNFIEQIVSSGGSIEGGPFWLRSDALAVSFNSLDPRLAGPLETVRNDPKIRLATQRLLSRGRPDSVAGAIGYEELGVRFGRTDSSLSNQVRAQDGEVIGDILLDVGKSILEDAADDVIDSVIDKIFGTDPEKEKQAEIYTWINNQLEWHAGVDDALAAISDELTAVSNQINDIFVSLTLENQHIFQEVSLKDDLMAANEAKDDIVAKQTTLIQALEEALGDTGYFSNEPTEVPQNVRDIVEAYQDSAILMELQTDVNTLQGLLTGNSNQPGTQPAQDILYPPIVVNVASTGDPSLDPPNLVLAQRDSVLSNLGIDNENNSKFANFPVRSAPILDAVLGPLEVYGQYQVLGANLIGEASHQASNPGVEIPKAKAYFDNVARSLRSTRAQTPDYPLNDSYFIDLQNGLQWCMVVQAPAGLNQAMGYASTYDDGDTSGWHVPSQQELRTLLLRGAWAAGEGVTYDFANTATGLQSLGFDLSNVPSDLMAFGVPNYSYVQPFPGFDGGWGITDQLQIPINYDFSVSPTPEYPFEVVAPATKLPYLMCRTLGDKPVLEVEPQQLPPLNGTQQQPLFGNPGTWPDGFLGNPIPAELPSVGIFTAFDNVVIPNLVVELTGTYKIFTGDRDGYLIGGMTESTDTNGETDPIPNQSNLPPVYYQTKDSAGVSVSNYARSFGKVVEHINSNEVSTIDYFTLGYDEATDTYPALFKGSVTFNTAGPTQINLNQLQLSPRNVYIDLTGVTDGDSVTKQFIALGFYSDETVQELTESDDLVFTMVDTDTNQFPVGFSFSTQKGEIAVTNGPNVARNVMITASINKPGNPSNVGSDSTLIQTAVRVTN